MTEETATTWQCPKDGMVMQQLGRRSRAWRCPKCRGMFIDREAMRRGQPPKWSPVVMSVLMSLLATVAVRRLLRRTRKQPLS